MQPDRHIQQELMEISPMLAGLPKTNVFSVPDGYFEELTPSILLNINRLKDNTPSVPDGYFDSLPGLIMNRIRQSEEESSLLASIPKTNVFSVPDGYFEQFPAKVIARVQEPSGAKVIGFNRTVSFFRYAVAACLTGILGLSLFSALNNAEKEPGANSPIVVAEGQKILHDNSYNQVLESVTDEEITLFLQSSGQDVNAALLASMTDENSLPDADEYMYDEQTLDRLMNELHISQSAQN